MILAQILIGLVALTAGRQLFWLFIGGVGFLVGYQLAPRLVSAEAEMSMLFIALLMGVLFGVGAIALQKVMIFVTGFWVGALAFVWLVQQFLEDGRSNALAFLVGGILGLLLAAFLFEWALIIITSLAGAVTLTQVFTLQPALQIALLICLFLAGILLQTAAWQHARAPRQPTSGEQ